MTLTPSSAPYRGEFRASSSAGRVQVRVQVQGASDLDAQIRAFPGGIRALFERLLETSSGHEVDGETVVILIREEELRQVLEGAQGGKTAAAGLEEEDEPIPAVA